jgi:uncharacterized damage-inducible protein DinB
MEVQMRIAICLTLVVFCLSLPMLAGGSLPSASQAVKEQTKGATFDSIIAYNKDMYDGMKMILLRAAEKMPEEYYNFRPTEAVRTYGQILGHIADAQYLFCALVLGEKNPAQRIEKTKTTKAELIAALKEAFAYGDRAYAAMTDESAVQTVKLFGQDTPKFGVLCVNGTHTISHYGNLVTYLRMKNIVPPTSEAGVIPDSK